MHEATRKSSHFVFATLYGYELSTKEEWCKPVYVVMYGNENWPSHSYWMLPMLVN